MYLMGFKDMESRYDNYMTAAAEYFQVVLQVRILFCVSSIFLFLIVTYFKTYYPAIYGNFYCEGHTYLHVGPLSIYFYCYFQWGRPKRTWREVVQKDCQARKLNREVLLWIIFDGGSWSRMVDDQDRCRVGWVNVSSGTISHGNNGQSTVKRLLFLLQLYFRSCKWSRK